MSNLTPKKFAIQQVFELLLRKTADKEIIAWLTDAKTTGLEKTAELVYPTGGRGHVYVGAAFSHTTRAKLTVNTATWNTEVFAVQNGTAVTEGAVEITEYDVITATTATTALTNYTALGITGSEIGFIYVVDEQTGTYTDVFTQATTVGVSPFTYAPGTRTITFSATDSSRYANKTLAMSYSRMTEATAQRIEVTSDGIPDLVLITAYGLAMDLCSGDLYPCVIEGRAQIDPNYNFDLSSDGEPAVQSLNMEFIKPCNSKNLYTFTIYTEGLPA